MSQQTDISHLQYPIGNFSWPDHQAVSKEQIQQYITEIEKVPSELRAIVAGMTAEQLNSPYRPGGWTAKQVIHHIADSHMNAYTRFKLTLTEDKPTIKPYTEGLWAEMDDARNLPAEVSLHIIDGIHTRWSHMMKHMSDQDFDRRYIHPQYQKEFFLGQVAALYAWHGKHHTEHVRLAAKAV